jgi:hypothetical protein
MPSLFHKVIDKAAFRDDVEWFKAHPDRLHRVRRSLAFERPEWDITGHLERPVMLSMRDGRIVNRWPVAGDLDGFPDDERFLTLLWRHLQFMRDTQGERFTLSPQSHLALLRMAGHSLENVA